MRPLLVLRPEPGASASARRAVAIGLVPIVAPLFTVRARSWDPPDADGFDAVLFTSANALRHAGPGLAAYCHLPAFAVGKATAAAARGAGFAAVIAGSGDAEQVVAGIDAAVRILHLCGEHRHAPARAIHQVPVYVAQACASLPEEAHGATNAGAVAMVHSPRAATLFARLVDPARRINNDIVAISAAAADAAGADWRTVVAAPVPTDAAMLAIARVLCEDDAR